MIKISILNSLGFFYLGFLIPIIAKENMNASGLIVGFIVASIVIGNVASSSFSGILTDRVKSKSHLLLTGSVFRGIAYFITYFAIVVNSAPILWIGGFTIGIGAGFFWAPFDTLVSEKSDKDHRSYAFGRRDAANAIGQTIGALFGFLFIIFVNNITTNPQILYIPILVFGISNFIAGFLFIKNIDETNTFEKISNVQEKENLNKSPEQSSQTRKTSSMVVLLGTLLLFIAILLSNINANIWRPFLNIYILEFITENLELVIIIYLPSGIIATLAAPKLGELMDNVNPKVGLIITSLVGAAMTWILINTDIIILFALIVLVDITISIGAGLLFRNLLSRITIKYRGTIMGYNNFFMNLGAIIGPILGGGLWEVFGLKSPFFISIFVELSLIPLFLIVIHILTPHIAETFQNSKS
jgi:MFS family permease